VDIQLYLKTKRQLVDRTLGQLLPSADEYPSIIYEAVRYSVFAGGKRLRPILCLAAAEALSGDSVKLLPVAAALELIHTYSLIHDDLPAMDDDDFRRGKPTCHKQFGEGIAILAGDALLTLAFEVISNYGLEEGKKDPALGLAVMEVIWEVASAAGLRGMIGGQVLDLQAETVSVSGEELKYIHEHKTGALFRASIRTGAILSGARSEELAALTAYSENFGLVFQITDDILDVTGDPAIMGKPVGSDQKNRKATYPAMYGLAKSRDLARQAVEKACASLSKLPGDTKPLEGIIRYLLERES